MNGFVIGLLIGLLVAAILLIEGYGSGFDHGMISVSSGQSRCELIEAEDKTTDWVCVTNQ